MYGILDRLTMLRTPLIALGALWSVRKAFSLLSFVRVYFLRRSTIEKYTSSLAGTETWALVTGASDGIGKGIAEELCSRDVNVVLHGRNEGKLQGVRDDLLQRWPTRQIRVLVADAAADASNVSKLDEMRESLRDINLRILINNVGGNGKARPLFNSFLERSSSDVGQFIDINARFPTELTRVLLPQLIQNQPSLVLNIGTGLSEFAAPYVDMYAGSKAYLQAWSRSVRLEMIDQGHDVEFLHLQLGGVVSNTLPKPENFLTPSARRFARYVLEAAGCGREIFWPYWVHALQFAPVVMIPEWIRNRIVLVMVKGEAEKMTTWEKSQ